MNNRTGLQVTGKHMIVAPASTLENWAREFTDWCPSLRLFLYYGSQEERADLRRRALTDGEEFDVIITTYNVCISNKLDRQFFKKLVHYQLNSLKKLLLLCDDFEESLVSIGNFFDMGVKTAICYLKIVLSRFPLNVIVPWH